MNQPGEGVSISMVALQRGISERAMSFLGQAVR